MKESRFAPIAVWLYLVLTVLAEVTIVDSVSIATNFDKTFVNWAILLLASTQVFTIALFYMRIRYETKYFGLLILGATIIGGTGFVLFLWGIQGVPIPHLK